MPVIGRFKAVKNGYEGYIKTLTIDADVHFVENTNKSEGNAADYKLFRGDLQIGIAWRKTAQRREVGEYLGVRIYDPLLSEPLKAALFRNGDVHNLVWRRGV